MARAVAAAGLRATLSLAGRVESPAPAPLPMRIGGFGGAEGLARWLRAERATHLIDATHPFASGISANAASAAAATGVPLATLGRPPWAEGPGDSWIRVADMDGAVAALAGPRRRVMLGIGRMHLADFAVQPQHFYLLRLVDPPRAAPPLPDCAVVVDRGPFAAASDRALLQAHGIEVVVSKNAGGDGARAKIDAARALGLPVVMIDRPPAPAAGPVFATPAAVLDWVAHAGRVHAGADLGV